MTSQQLNFTPVCTDQECVGPDVFRSWILRDAVDAQLAQHILRCAQSMFDELVSEVQSFEQELEIHMTRWFEPGFRGKASRYFAVFMAVPPEGKLIQNKDIVFHRTLVMDLNADGKIISAGEAQIRLAKPIDFH